MNKEEMELKSGLQTIVQKVFRNNEKLNSSDLEIILVKLTALFSYSLNMEFTIDISLFVFSKIVNYESKLRDKLIEWNENRELTISISKSFTNYLMDNFKSGKKSDIKKTYLLIYLLIRLDVNSPLINEISRSKDIKLRRLVCPFVLISFKRFDFQEDIINQLNQSLFLDNEVLDVLEQPLRLEIFNTIKSIRRSLLYSVGHISERFLESIYEFSIRSIETQNLLLDLASKSSKLFEDVLYQNNIESIGLVMMVKSYFINKEIMKTKEVSSFCNVKDLFSNSNVEEVFSVKELEIMNTLPVINDFGKKEANDILVLQDIIIRNSKIENGIFESIFMYLISRKDSVSISNKYFKDSDDLMLQMIRRLINHQRRDYYINNNSLIVYLLMIVLPNKKTNNAYLDFYSKRVLVPILEIGLKHSLLSRDILLEITRLSTKISSPFREIVILNCLNSSLVVKHEFIVECLLANTFKEFEFWSIPDSSDYSFNRIITLMLGLEIKIKGILLRGEINQDNFKDLNNECFSLLNDIDTCNFLTKSKKKYLSILILEKQLGIVSQFGINEHVKLNASRMRDISLQLEDVASELLIYFNIKSVSLDKLLINVTSLSTELSDLSASELGDVLNTIIKCLTLFRNFGVNHNFRSMINLGTFLIETIPDSKRFKFLFILEAGICFQNFDSCSSSLVFFDNIWTHLNKNQDLLEESFVVIKVIKLLLCEYDTSLFRKKDVIDDKITNILKKNNNNSFKEEPTLSDILNINEILIYKCFMFKSRMNILKTISEILFFCKTLKISKQSPTSSGRYFIEISKTKKSKESLFALENLLSNNSTSINILFSINRSISFLCKIMNDMDLIGSLYKTLELGLEISTKNKMYGMCIIFTNMKFLANEDFENLVKSNPLDIIVLLFEQINKINFDVKANSLPQILELVNNSPTILDLIKNLGCHKLIQTFVYSLVICRLKFVSKSSLIMYLNSFRDVVFGALSTSKTLEIEIDEFSLNRRISHFLKNTDFNILISLLKGKNIKSDLECENLKSDLFFNLKESFTKDKSLGNQFEYQKQIIDFIFFRILNYYHQYLNTKEKDQKREDHILIIHILEAIFLVTIELNLFYYSKIIKHAYLSCIVGLQNREEFLYNERINSRKEIESYTTNDNINDLSSKKVQSLLFSDIALILVNQELLFISLYKEFFQENKLVNRKKRKTLNRLTLKNSKSFSELMKNSYIISLLKDGEYSYSNESNNICLVIELKKKSFIKELIHLEHFDWIFNVNRKLIYFGVIRDEYADLSFTDVFPSPKPIVR